MIHFGGRIFYFWRRCATALVAMLVAALASAVEQQQQLDCSFRSQVSLLNGDLILEQIANPETMELFVRMTYTGEAWLSFGVSDNIADHMSGSEVVIAKPDESSIPQFYQISLANDAFNVLPESLLIDPLVEQVEGQTILSYTMPMNQPGRLPINLESETTWVYAIGASNEFGYHQFHGNFPMQVSQCIPEGQEPQDEVVVEVEAGPDMTKILRLWKVHGALLAIAWGILVPVAIGASLLRNLLPSVLGPGTWFKLHQGCNMLATIFTIIAFGIAVHNVSQVKAQHFSSERPHTLVGLFVFLLTVLQSANGMLRPGLPHPSPPPTMEHAPEDDDDNAAEEEHKMEKSSLRVLWEYGHRILGVVVLALAWYNCHSGLMLFVKVGVAFLSISAFWGVAGAIAGIVVVGALLQMATARQDEDDKGATRSPASTASKDSAAAAEDVEVNC